MKFFTSQKSLKSSRLMENKNGNDHGTDGKVWDVNESAKCPFLSGEMNHVTGQGTTNRDWWPNQLNLSIFSS